jgi:hypothetical protein
MNATRPEANTEYSRASEPLGTLWIVVAGASLGALVLLVSQFTTLYQVHVATSAGPIKSVDAGGNHAYALAPIAVAAAVMALAVARRGGRPAVFAIGVLGLTTLLIALIVDLPDAHASGLVRLDGHYVNASSTPSAGLYMETLAAVLLLVSSGFGLMLLGVVVQRPPWRMAGQGSARGGSRPS